MKNDSWRDGVLTLGATGGNNSLIRHAKGHFHVGRNANSIPTTWMTNALAKAAVPAIVLDFQTYGWLEGRGAKEFALALLQAGQRFPSNFSFDSDFVSALLLSRGSVTLELSLVAAENRKKDATKLITWFRYGGGCYTDGWKSDINWKTFYDLTLYFVTYEAPAKNAPGADAKAHLRQRVLFLAEHTQPGSSAPVIKLTLETALLSRYSVSISDLFCASTTLITDWAVVMARVADRSVSSVECGSVTLLSLVLSIRVVLEYLYKLLPDINTLVVN
jgi:hypothetical protein